MLQTHWSLIRFHTGRFKKQTNGEAFFLERIGDRPASGSTDTGIIFGGPARTAGGPSLFRI